MNGAQDVGGMMSFGPIAPEPEEPLFHAAWERRVLGMVLACGALGAWNLDMNRLARESLHPAVYWSRSYYEIWLLALTALAENHGLVNRRELETGAAVAGPRRGLPALRADKVAGLLAHGTPYDRPAASEALFDAGAMVRARNINPTGHTRLPRYARGKVGVVEAHRGSFVFPDTNARGRGENPQHLYTVRFAGTELWGEDCDPALSVSIDAFESYLATA